MIDTKYIFNKGVPSMKGISIDIDLLALNCALDHDKVLNILKDEMLELNDRLLKKYKYPYFTGTSLVTFSLDEDLNTLMVFEPDLVYLKCMDFLNADDSIVRSDKSDAEIKTYIRNQIKKLSKIRLLSNFEKEFPKLYEEYKVLEDLSKEYIEICKMEKNFNLFIERKKKEVLARKDAIKSYFDRFELNPRVFNYSIFIDYNVKLFSRLFNKDEIYDIMGGVLSCGIDLNKLDGLIDTDKLELLIASASLSAAKNREDYRVQNISYVTKYLDEQKDNINDDLSVEMRYSSLEDDKDYISSIETKRTIFDGYKKFLIEHPEVQILHKTKDDFEGYSLEDIDAYLNQYMNEIEVSWDILGGIGYDEGYVDRSFITSHVSDEDKQKHMESMERIFDEKVSFFEGHKPYCIVKGKNSFEGYMGYIYPNGKAVLEKFYSNKKGNRLAEDAIYIMDISDFMELTMKSKGEIINGELCLRVTHHKGWEGKVEDVITSEASLGALEDIQIFANKVRMLNKAD